MNHSQKLFSPSRIALAVLLAAAPMGAWAATAPDLGTAAEFSVLGGAGVTCTDSTITGAAGSLLTVTPTATCTIAGAVHAGDAVAIAANSDFLTAYDAINTANPCPNDAAHNLSGDLGGMTLAPGVYCISGVGLLTSKLTLDLAANNGGDGSGIWVFKAASSLTPIGGSVVMAGGGQACNVYWQTGTAVSLDATQFLGNILAGSAVTFTGVGSSLVGRALAKTAVTMTGTSVIGCDVLPGPGGGGNGNGNGNNCGNGHHGDNGHHYGHDKDGHDKDHKKCNQGVGNGSEDCDPGHSNQGNPFGSNDEDGGSKGHPGRKGGNNHHDD